jgi:triphosphatase
MLLEIELKLNINPDPRHVDLLFNHALLAQSSPLSVYLISRYFDTPDLSLWRQGLSLRLREEEDRTIQTLKTTGKQIGDLHHRHEWDQPIADSFPDIHAFEDKAVSEKLDAIIEKRPLIELFHTSFNRTQWNLRRPPSNSLCNKQTGAVSLCENQPSEDEDTHIELVLDRGSVNTVLQHLPLHEIELELKQGDTNQLYEIAAILKKTIPLTLETRSKAQRGYLLYMDDHHLSAVAASET